MSEDERAALEAEALIAHLRAENRQLRETIEEWQQIHGVNPASDVHRACQAEIEQMRRHHDLFCRCLTIRYGSPGDVSR